VKTVYQRKHPKANTGLAEELLRHEEIAIPMLQLFQDTQGALDDFIHVLGRACVEMVLQASAQQVAGPRHQGKPGSGIQWHGSQPGVVPLAGQKIRVQKPRLRRKGSGKGAEVPIPAYEAMQGSPSLRERLAAVLLRGVSTRHYAEVVPAMAESCGLSRSSVSREFAQACEAALCKLCERRFDEVDLLIIYIDGVRFGAQHVIGAVGVDREGKKHVLGLAQGATENAVVVTGLLQELVERGVRPERRRLFVIDGSKALRAGIDAVFGPGNPVQRCRNHKQENVAAYLPKELGAQVRLVMRAAWRLPEKEGLARLCAQAEWLKREYPSAAASLLEGLEETFTVNRLGLPGSLRRCLGTTNLVESPISGVRLRTGRVTRWRDGAMALRWAAAAYLETEKHFRRIMGHKQLWMLAAVLNDEPSAMSAAVGRIEMPGLEAPIEEVIAA